MGPSRNRQPRIQCWWCQGHCQVWWSLQNRFRFVASQVWYHLWQHFDHWWRWRSQENWWRNLGSYQRCWKEDERWTGKEHFKIILEHFGNICEHLRTFKNSVYVNCIIVLLLRFYVKSIFWILEVENLPFWYW